MFILGGICFTCCGLLNEVLPWEMPLSDQMLSGATIITALEFLTGCIVNIWLKWDVWDYSNLPLNICGQVCLYFSIAWYYVSGAAIVLDDYLRYWLFHEEKPHYKLF
nr:MAG TPA: putative membrane protein [Herelleviridae sp.]